MATLQIAGTKGCGQLSKNEHVRAPIGIVRLTMNARNLMAGRTFETAVFKLECAPSVAGLRPRDWSDSASCRFDGAGLTVTIRAVSVGLSARNHLVDASSLSRSEQLILTAPAGGLSLTSTADHPGAESPLVATFLLCDATPSAAAKI